MREWAEFRELEDEQGAPGLALSGPLVVSGIGDLDARQLGEGRVGRGNARKGPGSHGERR